MAAASGPGEGGTYLHLQAQEAARALAATLGQQAEAGHLLIALLDQGTAGITRTLGAAGLDPAVVRRAALAAIGASASLSPLALPLLIPAGTMDRPPLPVADLDARAWAVLRWRQEHLPLGRLRGPGDVDALYYLERDAAWRVAGRLGLDDDQRYSLVCQHIEAVQQLTASGRPDLAVPGSASGRPDDPLARLRRRRGGRRPRLLIPPAGWAVWLSNRRTGQRDRWFRLRTCWHYRGAPAP